MPYRVQGTTTMPYTECKAFDRGCSHQPYKENMGHTQRYKALRRRLLSFEGKALPGGSSQVAHVSERDEETSVGAIMELMHAPSRVARKLIKDPSRRMRKLMQTPSYSEKVLAYGGRGWGGEWTAWGVPCGSRVACHLELRSEYKTQGTTRGRRGGCREKGSEKGEGGEGQRQVRGQGRCMVRKVDGWMDRWMDVERGWRVRMDGW